VRSVAAYAIFVASYVVFALGKFPGMKIDRPGPSRASSWSSARGTWLWLVD